MKQESPVTAPTVIQTIANLATNGSPNATASEPRILHQGEYRLYEKPDGTLRVQYRREGSLEDEYAEIPGIMVKLSKAMAEGTMSPMQLMAEASKAMMSMR